MPIQKFLSWLSRMSFRTRITLIICWSMLFVSFVSSYSIYRVAMQESTKQLGARLMAVAISGSLGINGGEHAKLLHPADMESPTYKKIQQMLRKLRDDNADLRLRYVYTMMPTDKPGIWQYVVDSEPPNSRFFSMLGETEDLSYDSRFLRPITAPHFDREPRSYRYWGTLLTASAPIRNSAGESVGVLSVDAEPDSVISALMNFRRWAIGFIVLSVVLSILISFPIASHVTRPISALILATKAISQGDFDHRVNIPHRSELGNLAQAFNLMTDGLRERELYKNQFERYVSHQVARKILANPAKTFWGAERKRVTVLFCDIRGFTSMAAKKDPEAIIGQLNEFFSEMIDVVFSYEGTVDKFMGDAIMALFGAPISNGNDEERAIQAALAMQQRLTEMNKAWAVNGIDGFQIGIGINTGDVVVGNVGSEKRMEYSAIGDTVNMAARLENLNRQYNTQILISESTYDAVKHIVQARLIGNETLRGRSVPTQIYEVMGMASVTEIVL